VGTRYLNATLRSAYKNFKVASEGLLIKDFEEAAFKEAYDGILQVSRVVIALQGYKPSGLEQHKTTFVAATHLLGEDFSGLVKRINNYRIKRNNCVYDPINPISKTEARNILKTAKEYWAKVRKYLDSQNTQLELFDF